MAPLTPITVAGKRTRKLSKRALAAIAASRLSAEEDGLPLVAISSRTSKTRVVLGSSFIETKAEPEVGMVLIHEGRRARITRVGLRFALAKKRRTRARDAYVVCDFVFD